MIQPGRFRIHENTKVWALETRTDGAPAWRSFPIARRTAAKVIIATPDGERWIDRIPLERTGRTISHGVTYHLSRFALPAADDQGDRAA